MQYNTLETSSNLQRLRYQNPPPKERRQSGCKRRANIRQGASRIHFRGKPLGKEDARGTHYRDHSRKAKHFKCSMKQLPVYGRSRPSAAAMEKWEMEVSRLERFYAG